MEIQKITLAVIIIMGTIFSLNFFRLPPPPMPSEQNEIISPKKVVYVSEIKEQWDMLINNIDGYSIEYPYNLTPYKSANTISFNEEEYGPATFAVMVWGVNEIPPVLLYAKNNKVEKTIKIQADDGGEYIGIVSHSRGPREEFTYEKTLLVRKGDKYYIVNARGLDFDFERLWKGFRLK